MRRSAEPASKPKPDPRAPTVEELQAENRRLRGQVKGLEDDKRGLEERLSHVMRELEKTRKKIPNGIR